MASKAYKEQKEPEETEEGEEEVEAGTKGNGGKGPKSKGEQKKAGGGEASDGARNATIRPEPYLIMELLLQVQLKLCKYTSICRNR